MVFAPLKRLRRNIKYLLFGTIILLGVVVLYHEMVKADPRGLNTYSDDNSWWRAMVDKMFRADYQADSVEDSGAWRSNYDPPTWKPEFKGQANLHAFEDWCGSSTADLRRNMHYPLHPHSRTTVKKLAISPNWNNYGLRMFGYLHPYTNGEFVFAVSSDNNSEFWLSTNDSPLNVQLLAWVGKTGKEWTVPGEFEKYASQTSRPIMLSAQRRYFFEVIHKQDDKGIDHVEVAWKLLDQGFGFMVIDSSHISLYASEYGLLPSDVTTIPQTAASHQRIPSKQPGATADMLREDPRDTFYRVPLVNSKFLKGVLPDCSYKPNYTFKGSKLSRYQGVQLVRLSYIYPNDYTRLTHMETEDSCFYPERPGFMKISGFSRYMIPDSPEEKRSEDFGKKLQDDEEDHDLLGIKSMLDGQEDFVLRRRRSVLDDTEYFRFQRRKSFFDDKEDFGFQRRKSVLDDEEEFVPEDNQKEEEIWPGPKNNRKHLRKKEIENNIHLQLDLEISPPTAKAFRRGRMRKKRSDTEGEEDKTEEEEKVKKSAVPGINWNQTFQVIYQDLQALRSDKADYVCKFAGNLQLSSSETLPVVMAFMVKLEAKHPGKFTLVRVINVVKRVDVVRGSRYLLELEVQDVSGKLLRLSHYIYTLNPSSGEGRSDLTLQDVKRQPLLCNPVGFHWNPAATVHFIVPVKNQARWVQQLINDMERLFRETQDTNFNLIITDFSSSDMDVKKALEKSSLHRYQYLKLSGNFERSGGLQAGIDLINDSHSIVFLCDLHIHFPSHIIDAIRKHSVEGYMAFAPIVMRLDCGATPFDAKGFWEVEGYGLLGIYKSDLEAVGGMNTKEYKDTWGGEDWELIDRILEGGLEVERIYLRNFYHNFHSKRGMWVT